MAKTKTLRTRTAAAGKAALSTVPPAASQLSIVRVSRGAEGGIEVTNKTMAAAGGYDVAGGDRSFRSHTVRFEGADRAADISTRRKVVSLSRDLDRNSLLSAMIDRWVDGTVGSNINFRPTTGDDGWNKAAYELVKDRMVNCDHRGFFDAAALTRTMLRAIGTDGEQVWAMTAEGKIHVVETHQLGTPRDRLGGNKRLVDGIELADDGRVMGYWVSDESYGGYVAKSSNAQFVPAVDAIMPAYRKRATQTHGIPLVGSSLKLFDRVDGYIDNEALAAEIDACLAFFIKRKSPATTATPWNPETGRKMETAADGSTKVLRQIEPGMIASLGTDEEVDQFGAKRPGNQFTPFVEMGLTMVGATIGVPLPLALLDFKRLNYSNARTMLLQMWQTWQIWHRSTVVPAWQWAYQRWVLKEIAASAALRARDDAFSVKWLPRRWPWVDPLKEVQAMREEIALGGATITDFLEVAGYTLEEYLTERSHELERFAAMGVPTTTIAGLPAKAPIGQEPADKEKGWDEDEDEDQENDQ